jgi:hypothetical protein
MRKLTRAECGMVQKEVTGERGWNRRPRGLYVGFRGAKAHPLAEREATLLNVKTTEANLNDARAAPNCMKMKSAFLHEFRK